MNFIRNKIKINLHRFDKYYRSENYITISKPIIYW